MWQEMRGWLSAYEGPSKVDPPPARCSSSRSWGWVTREPARLLQKGRMKGKREAKEEGEISLRALHMQHPLISRLPPGSSGTVDPRQSAAQTSSFPKTFLGEKCLPRVFQAPISPVTEPLPLVSKPTCNLNHVPHDPQTMPHLQPSGACPSTWVSLCRRTSVSL